MRVVKSTPEEQHADQDEGHGNRRTDKVHPMDALAATKTGVFVIDIKTIPALFHLVNQPRQKSSVKTNQGGAAIKSRPKRALFPVVWEAESRKRNLRELREKHLKPFLPCGLRCDLPKTMTADCQ